MDYTRSVNERTALAVIDRDYGSLEDFAIQILSEKQAALDESLPLVQRAEAVGLPLPVFARVIASPQFRALLRIDLVNESFGIAAERDHVRRMVGVAKGDRKLVMSASGSFGEVDQAPADIIAAGKYLNELRGTPIEKAQQQAPSIVINIGKAEVRTDDDEEAVDVEVRAYEPPRAGGLPPAGARSRFGKAEIRDDAPEQADAGVESLYGRGAEEADEDHALAEKQARREEPVDGETDGEERPRGRWTRRWPGRGLPPQRVFHRGDDE